MRSDLQAFLVNLVRESGRTQADIARTAGITKKHMNWLMTGRAEGSLAVWSGILAAIGVRLPALTADQPTAGGDEVGL